MHIAFFSGSDFTLPLLEKLIAENHTIKLVTKPDTVLRGRIIQNKLKKFALNHGVEVWQPTHLKKLVQQEIEHELASYTMAIVASYGYIIPAALLNHFSLGMVNWHPSALPAYRGPTPVQTAIKNGDTTTAVTWIAMNTEMDAGDIIHQEKLTIDNEDTTQSVLTKAIQMGINHIPDVIQKVLSHAQDSYHYTVQDVSKVSFTHLLNKEAGHLNPHAMLANELRNYLRAYYPFPRVFIDDPYYGKLRIDSFGHVVSAITPQAQRGLFYQTKDKHTYLSCKEGYIVIKSITLANGQQVDFSGVVFN